MAHICFDNDIYPFKLITYVSRKKKLANKRKETPQQQMQKEIVKNHPIDQGKFNNHGRFNNQRRSIQSKTQGRRLEEYKERDQDRKKQTSYKRKINGDVSDVVRGVLLIEKIFLGGDFNVHIGSSLRGYNDIFGGSDFRERNDGGSLLLNFARA